MRLFPWQKRPLRTVWKLEKAGEAGLLVGTAHFSPYSFYGVLSDLVRDSERVLFEGPLDEASLAEVARYGSLWEGGASLYDALEPAVIKGINELLAPRLQGSTAAGSYLDLLWGSRDGFLERYTRGVRPWMAFFTVWTAYLDWKYSMDLEAFHIASDLGRPIGVLETIPEQLRALDGMPLERIVAYCNRYREWNEYRKRFSEIFLEGRSEHFLKATGDFPTRCEAIIGRRDPLFYAGICDALQQGPVTAFVGFGHCPGLLGLFRAGGYQVTQVAL